MELVAGHGGFGAGLVGVGDGFGGILGGWQARM